VRREKLRKQHSVTGCITVFIRTNPFNPQEPQYQPSASVKLDAATQDSRAIIATANRLLKEIYKAGYGYLFVRRFRAANRHIRTTPMTACRHVGGLLARNRLTAL